MKKTILFLMLISFCKLGFTQKFDGHWQGLLLQDGKLDTFLYQLNLQTTDGKITGISTSQSNKGGVLAKFQLIGTLDGNTLVLQEVQQLEPEGANWCLKHIRFQTDIPNELNGKWESKGCTPGTLVLFSKDKNRNYDLAETTLSSPLPLGKWTGHLSQSDREYGFFFETDFQKDGLGTSKIVSEDNGGTATHSLNWFFDEATSELKFEELSIASKTDPKWRWCIKSADLKLHIEPSRRYISGKWWGYIEGYTQETGACASGTLYLEQAILKPEETNTQKTDFQAYNKHQGRDIKLGRVLEVKGSSIKIRVWDNGIVDGDVLSLFLNGDRLLHNYRVTKRKYTFNIELEKKTNFLILHAEDLGDILPNTVAVSVDDGIKEQIVIISSNLRESGAVMIKQFTVGAED